jgi:hypothetical protein
LFQLSNIGTNAKTFLFGLPSVAAIGTGVFIVSPFLIYLVLPGRAWQRFDFLLMMSVLTAVLITLAFRSTGAKQIGYRFSLDYLPFVFWLLVRRLGAKHLPPYCHGLLRHSYRSRCLPMSAWSFSFWQPGYREAHGTKAGNHRSRWA